MRKINTIVDLDFGPLSYPERGAGEIAEPVDRNTGRLVEPGNQKSRGQMRQVMLDVVYLRFDSCSELRPKLDVIGFLESFFDRRRAADVFDFLGHQFRIRPTGQDKSEPAQIVHARFPIDRDMIDVA